MSRHVLRPEPLSAAAFAPFGQVIEARPDGSHHDINDGYAQRYHDLAQVDTTADGGRTLVTGSAASSSCRCRRNAFSLL
jgi:ureidoglycolate lyase